MRREVILPVTERAPLLARQALNEAIPPPALNGRSGDPHLVLSEVVTNAVKHGRLRIDRDVIRLVIEADDDVVRVEVEQATPALGVVRVEPRLDDPDHVGGFGLLLVEALVDDWGVESGPPGYVWFEFRR